RTLGTKKLSNTRTHLYAGLTRGCTKKHRHHNRCSRGSDTRRYLARGGSDIGSRSVATGWTRCSRVDSWVPSPSGESRGGSNRRRPRAFVTPPSYIVLTTARTTTTHLKRVPGARHGPV
ncbi:unnamed protein product, partial [Ectocarpus sp. 4 AP-2014]